LILLLLLIHFLIVIFILLFLVGGAGAQHGRNLMDPSNETWFDHEKLEVYREAIAFIAWLSALLEGTVRIGEVKDQLDRASTSIPLNIAEGNGKYAPKDRCRFFDIAHGSALECAAGLDVLVAKRKLTSDQIHAGKERLQRIVRMLMGLIKRNSTREYDRGGPAG
jgi:four helix bundle protein